MTAVERKKAHTRVKKLANDARHLAVYGRALDPTKLATFVAALADEVAKILAPSVRETWATAENKKAVDAVMIRIRSALRDARGKLRVIDALALGGFTYKSPYGMTIVGRAMKQLGWNRRRCRHNGQLLYAYIKGTSLQRECLLKRKRGAGGPVVSTPNKRGPHAPR